MDTKVELQEPHPVAHNNEEHHEEDHEVELVIQKPRTGTGTDTTSDSGVDMESARDILSFHAKGLLGKIERIPLIIKILMVALVSILGLVMFGVWLIVSSSSSLGTFQLATKIQRTSTPLQGVVTALAVERGSTASYVTMPGSATFAKVAAGRTASDAAWVSFNPLISELQAEGALDEVTRSFVNTLPPMMKEIIAFRASVDSGAQRDFAAVLDFYTLRINTLLTVNQRLCSMVSNFQVCQFHSYLLRMNEHTGITRATGSFLTNLGDSSPQVVRDFFKNNINYESMFATLLFASAFGAQEEKLKKTFEATQVTNLEAVRKQYLTWLAGNGTRPTMLSTTYFDIVTVRIEWVIAQLTTPTEIQLRDTAFASFSVAVGILVAVICSCIVCFLLSGCTTFCFSRTITGPWQRLLEVQEKTISMFVPTRLLSLMHIKTISELTNGMHMNRKLVLVKTQIVKPKRKFEKMTAEQDLQIFNSFLSNISRIISDNEGYIDKYYETNGFLAIYRTNTDALKATIAIHNLTEMVINKQNNNFPILKLHSGICSGHSIIATVGDNTRMGVSIISECTRIADALCSLNGVHKTSILATGETMHITKKYACSRFVSTMKLIEKEIEIHEVFEILRSDILQTKETFNNATQLFYRHKFAEARDQYESVHQVIPNDTCVLAKLFECDKMLHFVTKNHKFDEHDNIYTIFESPVLFEAFEQYAKKEYSYENIRLWVSIQHYKAAPKNHRLSLTQQLYKEFLDSQSASMVNINEAHKKNVKEAVDKASKQIRASLSDNLFDEIQADLEFNCLDIFKRFTESEHAKTALIHKKIVHEL